MDKRIIIVFLLIVLAIISAIVFNRFKEEEDYPTTIKTPQEVVVTPEANNTKKEEDKLVEVTDDKVEKIKEEAYLGILLQIQSFDALYTNYEPLLEAAMRIASEQGLLQVNSDGIYLEYVPRDVIHDIIFELSGVRVEEPIVIDDFYYLYDAEGDYYYVVPVGVYWMQLQDINTIMYSKQDDQYIINCSAKLGSEESGMITSYPDVELRIKYKPNNKYVKYQLISIVTGKSDITFSE